MNLEQDVIGIVHSAIADAIKNKLGGCNSPLDKIIQNAVSKNSGSIENILNDAIKESLVGDFREALKNAASKKLAKVLMSKMEGEIEKQANDLRSRPEFRAKLTISIAQVINDLGSKSIH